MTPLTLLGDLAPSPRMRVTISPDERLARSRLTLANLEVPLCPSDCPPVPKAGPHLHGDPEMAAALARAFPSLVVSLANNHVMDHGAAGLEATQSALATAGIKALGAGHTAIEAAAPLVLGLNSVTVGVIAACDRWFGTAAPDKPGVNRLGADLFQRVRDLKQRTDKVVVSVHGGAEVAPWPSPQWQETLRALVDAGADIVHAHHPHVALGWEHWCHGWIFYGLGNTVVLPARWRAAACTRHSWRIHMDLENLAGPPVVSAWSINPDTDGARLVCVDENVSGESAHVRGLNEPLHDPLLLEGLHQEYSLRVWETFYGDRANLGDTTSRRIRLLVRTLRDSGAAIFRPQRWAELVRQRGLFHYHLYSASVHAQEIATALGVIHGELPDRRTSRTRTLSEAYMPESLFGS